MLWIKFELDFELFLESTFQRVKFEAELTYLIIFLQVSINYLGLLSFPGAQTGAYKRFLRRLDQKQLNVGLK